MRQLLYVSTATVPAGEAELAVIVQQSRTNNALDGITGLLWSDGKRFAQVIEGDERAIEDAMLRIAADPRHRDILILHDATVATRQFGSWSMELRMPGSNADGHDLRMRHALEGSSGAIRDGFASLIAPVAV